MDSELGLSQELEGEAGSSGTGIATAEGKVTGIGIAEGTSNSSISANFSRMTVLKDLRVAGHTSLPVKTTYRVKADDNGTCSQVVAKFMDYAAYEADQPGDNTVAAKALAKLDRLEEGDPVDGQEAEDDLEEVANSAGLEVDMQLGEVITMTDENEMVECTTGESSALMEQPKTASGKPIVEGDMVFPDNESAQAALAEIASAHRYAGRTWPNGVVPYCVSVSAPQQMRIALRSALLHITRQVPCIKFQKVMTVAGYNGERCAQEPAVFVTAAKRGACYSYVGLSGGSQELNVGEGCWSKGIVAHEVGHSLGMAHEQSRPDRNSYVSIVWQNIQKGMEHNFKIESGAYQQDSYDPYSLMHYAQYDFSVNRAARYKTIDAKNPKIGNILGQRDGFSELDVKLLGEMYGCKDSVQPLVRNEDLAERLVGGGHGPSPGGHGPSPGPRPPMPERRKKTYVKIVFNQGLGIWSNSGAYALAETGTHSLKTPVRYDYNWAGEEGLLEYGKGSDIYFYLHNGFGQLLTNRIRVSATFFFPSGACNSLCSIDMGNGMQMHVCISVCKDGVCGCKNIYR